MVICELLQFARSAPQSLIGIHLFVDSFGPLLFMDLYYQQRHVIAG